MIRHSVLSSLVLSTALCSSALAQSYDQVLEARVIPGWTLEDGRQMIGLRLSLASGWKTYWRAPGDAGIPPVFDWSGSRNVAGVQVHWPTPEVFHQSGMRSIGYKNEVVIPLEVTPKRPNRIVRISADMSLGLCADVCMPYQISFEAALTQQTASPVPAIAAALAARPYDAAEAGLTNARCRLEPTEDGLALEAHLTLPYTGGAEHAVIETGRNDLWVSEPQTIRQGDTLVARSEIIHGHGGAFSVERSDLRITVLGDRYAVDIQGCTGS